MGRASLCSPESRKFVDMRKIIIIYNILISHVPQDILLTIIDYMGDIEENFKKKKDKNFCYVHVDKFNLIINNVMQNEPMKKRDYVYCRCCDVFLERWGRHQYNNGHSQKIIEFLDNDNIIDDDYDVIEKLIQYFESGVWYQQPDYSNLEATILSRYDMLNQMYNMP